MQDYKLKINDWLDYNLKHMSQSSTISSGHIDDILKTTVDSKVFLKTALELLKYADISKIQNNQKLLLIVYLQSADLDELDCINSLENINTKISNTPPEFIITSNFKDLLQNKISIKNLPEGFLAYKYLHFDSVENVFDPMIIIYKESDKEQIIKNILSNNTARIINGLLVLFMNKIDKDLAIQYAKWAIYSDVLDIKKIGIIGMGHIARVYGLDNVNCFDNEIKMIEHTNNADLIGILEDAKDDFSVFIK